MAPKIIGRARRLSLALLLLAAVPLATGCNVRVLNILIPDFDQSGVDGVQVWRIDDVTGEASAAGSLEFVGTKTVMGNQGPVELVEYEIVQSNGARTGPVLAKITRDEASPGAVQMHLIFRTDGGVFKVSAYNEAGSSPLSEEAVELL